MNKKEVDELELFYRLATKGEWQHFDGSVYDQKGSELLDGFVSGSGNAANDAQFTAKIHNAFPQLLARIRELEAQPPTWVSVAERLPEERGAYIVCNKRGTVSTEWYSPMNQSFVVDAGISPDEVTHWQNLPSPPTTPTL